MSACVCACVRSCTHARTHAHAHTHARARTHTRTSTRTRTHTHAYTRARACTHTREWQSLREFEPHGPRCCGLRVIPGRPYQWIMYSEFVIDLRSRRGGQDRKSQNRRRSLWFYIGIANGRVYCADIDVSVPEKDPPRRDGCAEHAQRVSIHVSLHIFFLVLGCIIRRARKTCDLVVEKVEVEVVEKAACDLEYEPVHPQVAAELPDPPGHICQ